MACFHLRAKLVDTSKINFFDSDNKVPISGPDAPMSQGLRVKKTSKPTESLVEKALDEDGQPKKPRISARRPKGLPKPKTTRLGGDNDDCPDLVEVSDTDSSDLEDTGDPDTDTDDDSDVVILGEVIDMLPSKTIPENGQRKRHPASRSRTKGMRVTAR
ncbi:hypothetical protein VNI00_016744 [Paramarasmius palmivorus]|uniref:Uncharacterized protein n=1 Tax=Paramarasmius palmivorus TaxID=297713 RepID=A0AAW0BBT1_9AGAR